eukprot:gene13000-biopygen5730
MRHSNCSPFGYKETLQLLIVWIRGDTPTAHRLDTRRHSNCSPFGYEETLQLRDSEGRPSMTADEKTIYRRTST